MEGKGSSSDTVSPSSLPTAKEELTQPKSSSVGDGAQQVCFNWYTLLVVVSLSFLVFVIVYVCVNSELHVTLLVLGLTVGRGLVGMAIIAVIKMALWFKKTDLTPYRTKLYKCFKKNVAQPSAEILV